MKTFFVICPIGGEDSEERKRSDRVLKHLIQPAVKNATDQDPEHCVSRADSIAEPGRITKQILEKLVSADVVIADLTGANANVMYELGLRQGLLKPYVLLCEKNQKLPFDLTDLRTIFYQLELDEVDRAREELTKHISSAINGDLSVIDKELLSGNRGSSETEPSARSTDFQLLEANSKILSQLEEMKEVLIQVGGIVVDIREKEQREYDRQKEQMNQQFGMDLLSKLLQNPENIDKTLPAMQMLMEFGQKIEDSTNNQGHNSRTKRSRRTR